MRRRHGGLRGAAAERGRDELRGGRLVARLRGRHLGVFKRPDERVALPGPRRLDGSLGADERVEAGQGLVEPRQLEVVMVAPGAVRADVGVGRLRPGGEGVQGPREAAPAEALGDAALYELGHRAPLLRGQRPKAPDVLLRRRV